MDILFTICGRAGSKGIKNKNIRNFLGKPLPLYSIAAISLFMSRHKEISADVALNTDCKERVDIINRCKGVSVSIIQRKPELAGDVVGKIAVIGDSLVQMKKLKQKEYDMVVDLDITSPLRTIDDIERLISKKEKTRCDLVFSVVEARRNPYFNMVTKKDNGYKKVIESNFVARQQAPEVYDMNASLYAYSSKFLESNSNLFDGHCEIVTMYDTGILDLDHVHDFEIMEIIAQYLFENKPEFAEIRNQINSIYY